MKIVLSVIAIVVVIAVGYLLLVPNDFIAHDSQTQDTQQQNEMTFGAVTTWETMQSQIFEGQWKFSIAHPQQVIVANPQTNIYTFKYIGPNSEAGTEITDGFYVTLTASTANSIEMYVENASPNSAINNTTFGAYQAKAYTTESELGSEVSHVAFSIGENSDEEKFIIDVTRTLSGEASATGIYQNTIVQMFDTLTFSFVENTDGEEMIRVTEPSADATITNPVTISGEARGTWYFEAVFPIDIADGNGNVLGQGVAQAEGDWMTEDFVPFTAEIEYEVDTPTEGFIVLHKDNPSGLPENDATIQIPVTLSATN